MPKTILKVTPTVTPTNIFVTGLVSHENDYRLSWALNQHFNIHLRVDDVFQYENPKSKTTNEFSYYYYFDSQNTIEYHLIANRCNNGFLLDDFKAFDFIFIIFDCNNVFDAAPTFRNIDLINTSANIDSSVLVKKKIKLKSQSDRHRRL
jgi:hypothetical protein